MLENIWGHSRSSIPPLRMPSPLPHDLCHEWNVSRRLPAVYMWGDWKIDMLHYLLKITKQIVGRTGTSPKGVRFQHWQVFLWLGTCSMAQGLIIPIVAQWQRVHLPVQETQEPQVRSLGREDPLEKEMQPVPIFLPGKSHGQRSLVGCSPWDCRVGHGLATKQQTIRRPEG